MNKFMDVLSEKLLPIAAKIGSNRYLTVLRDAFMLSFPLTMFGSFIVVLNNLPFWPEATRGNLNELLGNGQNATMAIVSIFVSFGIGYYLTKSFDEDGVFGGVVALSCFLILTPFHAQFEKHTEGSLLTLERLGAKGMFLAMIAAFLSARIYVAVVKKGWQIKMPQGVPPQVANSFAALIPAFLSLSTFLFIGAIMTGVFHENLHDLIYEVVQAPLIGLGTTLPATLVALFFVQLLWFFGLHGQIIVNSIMDPIWNTASTENYTAFVNGEKVPHIITKSFIETFTVSLGGSGMTLAAVVILAFFLKNKQFKEVGRLALAPGLFNVNEPIIFGLPIVMNPIIFIPWLISPIIVTIVNYFAIYFGLVPAPTGVAVAWTIPIGISGFLATNSIMGGLLQVVDFLIVFVIWFLFLKIMDRNTNTEL